MVSKRFGHVSRALVTILATALLMLATGGSPAWAHTKLSSTAPAANAIVPVMPDEIVLTFSDNLTILPTITVRDADGVEVNTGPATLAGATARQPIRHTKTGAYTVTWQATAPDGHRLTGSFAFTTTAAPPAPSTPSAAPTTNEPPTPAQSADAAPNAVDTNMPAPRANATGSSGVPWLWLAGGATLIVVVAAVGLLARRRASQT